MKPLAFAVVVAYLALTVIIGVVAGRRGRGDTSDYVAGERSFGPVVMYFVVGATARELIPRHSAAESAKKMARGLLSSK